jgi:hypothetical protein
MMVSQILQSPVLNRRLIRAVFCVSALLLGSQLPHESPRDVMAISPITQQPAQSPRALDLGAPIEAPLETGQSHQYRVTLADGEFIHVVVEQQGVDVEVTVFDPDGKQLLQVDGLNGQYGPESVSIVALAPGDYRLQARAMNAAGSRRYQIELKTKRMATPQDREIVKAERNLLDALSLEFGKDFLKAKVRGRMRTFPQFGRRRWRSEGAESHRKKLLSFGGDAEGKRNSATRASASSRRLWQG